MADKEINSQPGKTSPRLLLDLKEYDPIIARKGVNALTDFPPKSNDLKKIPIANSVRPNHTHDLILKSEVSKLPENPLRAGVRYNVATICRECRVHIDVRIQFPERSALTKCGPDNAHYPLHHFQYHQNQSQPLLPEARDPKHPVDKRVFICSASTCAAMLTITTRLPFFSNQEIELLTSRKKLEERIRKATLHNQDWASDPVRSPYDVFCTINAYMKNALRIGSKSIPTRNRRVMQCFGDEAKLIFRKAHFELSPDGLNWIVPEEEEWDRLNMKWRDIYDIFEEMNILMDIHKENRDFVYRPIKAEKELQYLLSCDRYDALYRRDYVDLTTSRTQERSYHPNYAVLGAVGDFKDALLLRCYDLQKIRDPDSAPYYLECLQDIAEGRGSEFLQIAVAERRSQGEFSTRDVNDAYKQLHLDPEREHEDNVIIGKFRAFVSDAPRQEAQLRQCLWIIGTSRRSQAIIQASQNVISDVKQAYQYLGADETIDDHFILSLYEVKIKDHPEEENMAKDALRLIAATRNSPVLSAFIDSGTIFEQPLDIGVAYSRLDIPRDQEITDDMIIQIYKIRVTDGAANLDLREALRAIGEDRNSTAIRAFLRTGEMSIQAGKPDWPVGLENIGNTCYLNSLLQYYFTIYPLREMILQFDSYQEDMSETILQTKRVGGRRLTTREVERAKKFVSHLRTLFNNMISSTEASVTPEYDLAYLALVSSKDEAKESDRRNSLDDMPALITMDGVTQKDGEDSKMEVDNSEGVQTIDDAGSEITLVEKAESKQNDDDFVMIDGDGKSSLGTLEDKENLPPKLETVTNNIARPVLQDIDINGSITQEEQSSLDPKILSTTSSEQAINPDHPPPIPPRPTPKTQAEEAKSYTFGRQQDVAECIENVMFQIEAAIQAEDIDENGEQIDLVKRLFYGKTKQSLQVIGSAERRSKIELFSHLLIDVASGSRDIYAALDSVFDVSTVNVEGKDTIRYLSISQLPPVLQLQVQRVQFDRATGRAYKSTAHLKFPQTIYMDRYLDSSDSELQAKREEAWAWKSEIAELEKRKAGLTSTSIDIEAPDALKAVRKWLDDIHDSEDRDIMDSEDLPDVLIGLDDGIKIAAQELEDINKRLEELQAKAAVQFDGYCKHGYRIHSIFIHRGSASFGHYWIYIYDFQRGFWRKYNDGYVTQVEDENEVFNQEETNPATPYFLVFVREDRINVMEAVKRNLT